MTDEESPESNNEVIDIGDFKDATKRLTSNIHDKDVVRSVLARRLLWLVSGLSSALILAIIAGLIDIDTAKDAAGIIIVPITGVLATVIGFYFGSESSSSTKG